VNSKILIDKAQQAKKNSFSPYSKLRVGAAIISTSGKIFTGCNIENSSYSLTVCAERTAIFKAISEGYRDFAAIAIVSDLKEPVPPCGACRQVLLDLAGNVDLFLSGTNGKTKRLKLAELLPMPFDQSFLNHK